MNKMELTERLIAICGKINSQNLFLIMRLDSPDFEPGRELDCTLNDAQYYLTDFFDIVSQFRHGSVPTKYTDEMLKTTDELLEKIKNRYSNNAKIIELADIAGHSFRASKRIWRNINPVVIMSHDEYSAEIKKSSEEIFKALFELNLELRRIPSATAPEAPSRAMKLFSPDLKNLADCRRFCHELYEEVRGQLNTKLHSETQAVSYILTGATTKDPFYAECAIARCIKLERNWSRITFMTYCKKPTEPAPKPRTIKVATKKRNHQKMTQKLIREIS